MYVGKSVARIEDRKFLAGQGRFVDDIAMTGARHAVFLRSPHANAAIRAIDTTAAAAMPGVVVMLTGTDWRAQGGGELPCIMAVAFSDGRPMASAPRQVFAAEHARHVGDPVAMIVRQTRHQVQDAPRSSG